MGRRPCCNRDGLQRGAWSQEEDQNLVHYIPKHGPGDCGHLLLNAGHCRCGKSCHLRSTNYLRSDVKCSPFAPEEVATIIQLHSTLGNKWSAIASQLPGRTGNEIKNLWNNCLKSHSGARQKLQVRKPISFMNVAKDIHNSPSTPHMARREGARGDGAQMSTQSKLLNSSTAVAVEYYDPFLRLWNSEVGESFRWIDKVKEDRACDESFVQAPLSVKLEETVSSDHTVHGTTFRRSISRETTHKQENSSESNANLHIGLDSMNSNTLTGSSYAEGDPFLRLWNSEAGELFRKIKVKEDRVSNVSFAQASASVKLEPGLSDPDVTARGATLRRSVPKETSHEQEDCYKPNEYLLTGIDSGDTNAFADSSDAALKLLPDFPGGSDMEIIQGHRFF